MTTGKHHLIRDYEALEEGFSIQLETQTRLPQRDQDQISSLELLVATCGTIARALDVNLSRVNNGLCNGLTLYVENPNDFGYFKDRTIAEVITDPSITHTQLVTISNYGSALDKDAGIVEGRYRKSAKTEALQNTGRLLIEIANARSYNMYNEVITIGSLPSMAERWKNLSGGNGNACFDQYYMVGPLKSLFRGAYTKHESAVAARTAVMARPPQLPRPQGPTTVARRPRA